MATATVTSEYCNLPLQELRDCSATESTCSRSEFNDYLGWDLGWNKFEEIA
jgi:hypothetical protein